ncbi:hypothetical protein EV666_101560 [Camelimonas lactis]|uniref:Uncharacterized protein n=1 Tax=Camelimonas lactis TaxID=659006 RepID=A0A4R2GYX6_9HYPH|nr:hypothetical protein EV666_101560 [Camelimonas lactis]
MAAMMAGNAPGIPVAPAAPEQGPFRAEPAPAASGVAVMVNAARPSGFRRQGQPGRATARFLARFLVFALAARQ